MQKLRNIFPLIFGIIVGCSDLRNIPGDSLGVINSENIACVSACGNYFVQEGREINIRQVIEDMRKDNNADFSYDSVSGRGICNRVGKTDDFDRTRAICKYLGSRNGKYIVFRYIDGNFSGRFTDIIIFSLKNNKMKIHEILFPGDRALDGIKSDPVFDGRDRIYFDAYLSFDTFAGLSGINPEISEKIPNQAAQNYWNVSKCVYNLETEKLTLLSVFIKADSGNSEFLKKLIPEFEKFQKNDGLRISKKEIPQFLKTLKNNMLQMIK